MLHAAAKGKTKFYERYLGRREPDDVRVCEEDEITSTIIGPMDFMSPNEIHQFWAELFRLKSLHDVLPEQPPESMEVKLWPSRPAPVGDGKRIEPDATIEFLWSDKTRRILLIEFKWRASLSGKDQLHRQWVHYLTPNEREYAFHLFIAPVVAEGASAKNSDLGDVWGDRLVLITWETFRHALNSITNNGGTTTGLRRWSASADNFLARIGINKFVGFGHLAEKLNFCPPFSSPLFWQPFQGFKQCEISAEIATLPPAPMFFVSSS